MSRNLFPLSFAAMLLSGTAMAEVPRVAVDIAPVHSLVARVMAPFQAAEARVAYRARMAQRALRRTARAIPARIDMVVARWRLGQAEMAAVLVAMLAVEGPALVAQIMAAL